MSAAWDVQGVVHSLGGNSRAAGVVERKCLAERVGTFPMPAASRIYITPCETPLATCSYRHCIMISMSWSLADRENFCRYAVVYSTCGEANGGGGFVDLDGFERRVQLQDELVEIIQGDFQIVIAAVGGGLGLLLDGVLGWIQADGLAHSQNMIRYHALNCRHHVRAARKAS